jgi:hypothetical protein
MCPHPAPTIYSVERGFALKADCGSRARCYPVRERWRRQTRRRLERVEYRRVPDLWTITARTIEQDAACIAHRFVRAQLRAGESVHSSVRANPESLAPLFLSGACAPARHARDRGDPGCREDVKVFSVGLSRIRRAVHRQFERQRMQGYRDSRQARLLRARYDTAFPVRGRAGADWRLWMKEAGEQNGRLHAHAASDFDFVHHGWLSEVARRCGLGFVQYSRTESAQLRRSARAAGPRVRAHTIARYLASYLGKGDAPGRPWPWPHHTRLLNAARGVLPAHEPAEDCYVSLRSVAEVAIDYLGAVWIEATATFFSVKSAAPGQVAAIQPLRALWG